VPTIRDEAVCLRRWEFSETSQTVCLLTREHGILRGLAKGARRDRGRFSGGFDILTRGEIVAITKVGRDLATLTDWHLRDTARALRTSLSANKAGLYGVDLMYHMLTDQDPHPALFDQLVRTLSDLADPGNIGAALLRLQWAVAVECGFRPVTDRDARTGEPIPLDARSVTFDPEAGGTIIGRTTRGWQARRSTMDLLAQIEELPEIGPLPVDADCIDRANRLLAAYLRDILGFELNSTQWCFGDLTGRPRSRRADAFPDHP